MQPAEPMPIFLNEAGSADRGLICGYRLEEGRTPIEVAPDGVLQAFAADQGVAWLHFNLSDARARRWLLQASPLPQALREVLQEHDGNRRMEAVDGGVLFVISDFAYEHEPDAAETAPLWGYAAPHLLITARLHPVKSSDELRLRMRASVEARSGIELAVHLLEIRTTCIKRLASGMSVQLDDIEDEVLAGNIKEQRQQLGRARRLCARLRREFAPERSDFARFLHRDGQAALSAGDHEALAAGVESLAFALEEIAELYERAKLLQEELASRLAENTGRNLYVLSLLTAVLLPMTLVTGVFGMNVAGLPGLRDPGAFWWVMFLIIVSGGATLALLFWRRLL
jgi:zinc transporter